MIYIARILYPVRVLGPGERIGIWFEGCGRSCKGCSNPELWEQKEEHLIDMGILQQMIQKITSVSRVDGFTLTGGEPFLQPEALNELIPFLCSVSDDILVYTGFLYEDLAERYSGILSQISVLIDGPYIEECNHNVTLRGSDNQRMFFRDENVRKKYSEYLLNHTNQIQNFCARDGVISVGIHRPGYNEAFKTKLQGKGVLIDE